MREPNMPAAFADCWNSHDMAAFTELFEPEAHFVNVFGTFWRGREQIRRAHEATHATVFAKSRLSIDGVDDKLLGEKVIAQHVHWTLEGLSGPDGKDAPPRKGLLLLVSRRDEPGGQWRIAVAQNTDKVIDEG